MDLQVRSTHQMAEPSAEERIVTKIQKGEGVQVQNQGNADRFFDVHGIFHTELLHKAKLLISMSTKTSCNV